MKSARFAIKPPLGPIAARTDRAAAGELRTPLGQRAQPGITATGAGRCRLEPSGSPKASPPPIDARSRQTRHLSAGRSPIPVSPTSHSAMARAVVRGVGATGGVKRVPATPPSSSAAASFALRRSGVDLCPPHRRPSRDRRPGIQSTARAGRPRARRRETGDAPVSHGAISAKAGPAPMMGPIVERADHAGAQPHRGPRHAPRRRPDHESLRSRVDGELGGTATASRTADAAPAAARTSTRAVAVRVRRGSASRLINPRYAPSTHCRDQPGLAGAVPIEPTHVERQPSRALRAAPRQAAPVRHSNPCGAEDRINVNP